MKATLLIILPIFILILIICFYIYSKKKEKYGPPPGRNRALISSHSSEQPKNYLENINYPNDYGLSNVNYGAANPVYAGNTASAVSAMIMRTA